SEFCDDLLPGGRSEYLTAIRDFLGRLYASAAGDKPYFLEKTPRYHLIAEDLRELFPDAKPIFLWRNPVAIAASMIESWNRGHWNLDVHAIDLFRGIESLTDAFRQTDGNAISVQYERLVSDSEAELAQLYEWLGLDVEPPLTPDLAHVPLRTSLG